MREGGTVNFLSYPNLCFVGKTFGLICTLFSLYLFSSIPLRDFFSPTRAKRVHACCFTCDFLKKFFGFSPSLPSPTLKYSVPKLSGKHCQNKLCSLLIIYSTYSATCYRALQYKPFIYLVSKGGTATGKRNKCLEFSFSDKSLLHDICDCPIAY